MHIVHLEHHLQLVAEACLLDGHVVTHLLQLLLNIDQLIPLVEVVAQVVRQIGDELARLLGPDADQRRDGVEGIEQEVRVDLALQGGELRLAGHLLELLDARHLHLGGDELGETHRHLLEGAGDAVGAAIVDLEGAADGAVFPQRNNDDRVEIGEVILAQIVVDDDLVQQHRSVGHVADGVVLVQLVVILAHPHIGQHVAGIGDGHRIGADLAANDAAHLAQGVAIDVLEKRQRLVGDVERQLGLLGGNQLLLVIQILHQLDDEPDTERPGDHRVGNMTDYLHTYRMGLGQLPDKQHGQPLAGHPRQDAIEPEPRLATAQVQPGGQQAGDDAGDETGNGGVAIHVDEIAVQTRDDPGRNADPGAEQDAARDDGDDPHIDEGPLHRNAGVGAEHREQTEDGRHQHQLGRGVIPLLEQPLERPGASQEKERHQHQRRPLKHRQQHHLIFEQNRDPVSLEKICTKARDHTPYPVSAHSE